MKRIFFTIIIFCILLPHLTYSLSLAQNNKRAIVLIISPDKYGSGFLISYQGIGLFIVTNKHVLTSDSSGQYYDSVFICENTISEGDIITETNKLKAVHLKYNDFSLMTAHDDPDVDLVLIQVGNITLPNGDTLSNPVNFDKLVAFNSKAVANRQDFKRLNIIDGKDIQLVGFSFFQDSEVQYHISRFGKIALRPNHSLTIIFDNNRDSIPDDTVTSEWIILDITSRSGDSGGPVFLMEQGLEQLYLIGFVKGNNADLQICYAQPSYYISDLLEKFLRHEK